jgi:hypothetical protein
MAWKAGSKNVCPDSSRIVRTAGGRSARGQRFETRRTIVHAGAQDISSIRCAGGRGFNVEERVATEPGRPQSRSADADAPDLFQLRPERWLQQVARADD